MHFSRLFTALLVCIILAQPSFAQSNKTEPQSLQQLQQEFVQLRFGMFLHFGMPTFMDQDWADPEATPALFRPRQLDCGQWAQAAQTAGMTYGCLTTKHHSGFAIWNTKTTDYNVMNSPLKRDVVREFVDAFRARNLKVMLYYSILDTHHELRPGTITPKHVDLVKAQLTELLTQYGPISALIIDGWDAPWSRISYETIPFEEIYRLVKSLQPNCLVMDLNAAKYPAEALYYTDIKSYEQGAGQHISKEQNRLPALSCLPLNAAWFWKTSFPAEPVKAPAALVRENLVPLNKAYCNFILNVAPNRDGRIDDNALAALAEIGRLWKHQGPLPPLVSSDRPIIASNLAKRRPARSSWSDDMWIMDFGNDDNFSTSWQSNPKVTQPWYEVTLDKTQPFNQIVIAEAEPNIREYRIEYFSDGKWLPLLRGTDSGRIKVHRFTAVWGAKVRLLVDAAARPVRLAELGVYHERP